MQDAGHDLFAAATGVRSFSEATRFAGYHVFVDTIPEISEATACQNQPGEEIRPISLSSYTGNFLKRRYYLGTLRYRREAAPPHRPAVAMIPAGSHSSASGQNPRRRMSPRLSMPRIIPTVPA